MQPYITVKDFKGRADVAFTERSSPLTDELVNHPDLQDLKPGWKTYVRRLCSHKRNDGTFDDVAHLKRELAPLYPPASARALEKKEKKRVIKTQHRQRLGLIDATKVPGGKKLRRASFRGQEKFDTAYRAKAAHAAFRNQLLSTSHATETGQVYELTTGNPYQSMMAFDSATLPPNTPGVSLEGVYHPVHAGLGPPAPVRAAPFTQPSERLRRTVASDEGGYPIGAAVTSTALDALEMARFPENRVPTAMRGAMVTGGLLDLTQEHNPVGDYTMHEMPDATKATDPINQLVDQGAYEIYRRVSTLPPATPLGRHAAAMPPATTLSTVRTFTTAFAAAAAHHDQATQNALHREAFRVARADVGPLVDDSSRPMSIDTPPGSPFDATYGYGT